MKTSISGRFEAIHSRIMFGFFVIRPVIFPEKYPRAMCPGKYMLSEICSLISILKNPYALLYSKLA